MHINIQRIFSIALMGAIMLCGFFIRLESAHKTEVINPLHADAGNYFMYAFNLRFKHTYSLEIGNPADIASPVTSDAIRPPAYPLFLSTFVDSVPNQKTINKILYSQVIISTLTIFISMFLFQNFLSKLWATIAAMLVTLSPHLIVANSYILTETFFCFHLVILGWFMSLFVTKPSLWKAGIIGIILGMANLIRPSLQYFPIVMSIFLIFQYGKKEGGRFCIAMLLGFALLFFPWITRNLLTLNIITDNSLSKNFLHQGMYPNFKYKNTPESYGFPHKYDPNAKNSNKNTLVILKEITKRFRTEPLRHCQWFLLQKPIAFWSWDMVQGQGDAFIYPVSRSPYNNNSFFQWTSRLMYALHGPIVILALFGSLLIWVPHFTQALSGKTVVNVKYTSILLIYFTVIHMIGFPLPRYSIPLRPFIYGMAIFSSYTVFLNIKHKN